MENKYIPVFIGEINENFLKKRVRVIGHVVDKGMKDNIGYLEIVDDSLKKISVRVFGEDVSKIKGINLGDLIEVFGEVREWKEKLYIVPKIVKKRDENYALYFISLKIFLKLRDKVKNYKKEDEINIKPASEVKEEDIKVDVVSVENSLDKRIYNYIKEHPKCTIDEICENLKARKEEVEEILKELLINGEIYEPEPGKFDVV